jgi:hypothetical protein
MRRVVMNQAQYLESRLAEYMAWRYHRAAFRTMTREMQDEIISDFAEKIRLADSGDRSTSALECNALEVASARSELPEWVAVAEAESNL